MFVVDIGLSIASNDRKMKRKIDILNFIPVFILKVAKAAQGRAALI